ncbi:MAG: YdiU family protein [Porticoccaceae bacterium]|jgi:serine/tyrosine/threonine adenylyltransferase|nr:YdiU family protein [Alphaproteobacteria bacterium]MDP4743540.1 YdiU family protein [Porticoccaceae bacterium]MDP4752379.1 YdiU family protein [Porticoccaceae bacterium]MDP4890560.1 YdiU family protein [Porticoccaceae bacterium]
MASPELSLTAKLHHSFFDTFKDRGDLHFSPVVPSRLDQPTKVSSNSLLATQLGIDPADLESQTMLDLVSGNFGTANIKPIALVYSGHQFGVWAGQLGDGRAMTLGELPVTGADGKTELWDIQLKGAGPTPYSRFADGRAVLRSSIREYLCSEAMHGLGIASTRALCLLDSKTRIYREDVESGAIVCRVARSHIRFGSFEHFHYRNQPEGVAALADYVIDRHFPEWAAEHNRYLKLFTQTVENTAKMIAQWQAVGFSHGVMNTDNMSILGDTLDYGPFGFLDSYNPNFICNHSDSHGRYSFKNQPSVGLWNLNALATSLMSLLSSDELIAVLKTYEPHYLTHYRALMAAKLGLLEYRDDDEQLLNSLLELLQKNALDYSLFFRQLCTFSATDQSVRDHFIDRDAFDLWAEQYLQRLVQQPLTDQQRCAKMLRTNPKYVLRNYMAQAAIEKAQQGDYSEVNLLLRVLQNPFDEHPEAEKYAGLPPDWADHISVSCSS